MRKLYTNKNGYLFFSVRFNNIKHPKNIPVHRLQAYQKFGDTIFDKNVVVRHLDGNPQNNSYENIGIGTQSENMYDIPKEKRIAHAKHASSFNILYDAEKVKEFYYNCKSYKLTMEQFNIPSKSTLHNIIHKR
jgi:hypothetical protein